MIRHFATALLCAGVLASCAHTNELSKYTIKNQTVEYRYRASGDASSASATVTNATPDPVLDVAAAIGADAASAKAQAKLARAVSADSLASKLSLGMETAVHDYLQMKESPDNSLFIVETVLTKYQLSSSSTGISALVQGTSRIIERASGKIVWENSESETIPLRSTSTDNPAAGALASAINAGQLVNLSEREIRAVLGSAAEEVGNEMGETLREDVAKMKP